MRNMIMSDSVKHISGDFQHGLNVTHDLTGNADGKIQMRYAGRFVPPGMSHLLIDCEIYVAGNHIMVHTLCPKCRQGLKIESTNKQMLFDKEKGTLEIEEFQCTWEMPEKEFGSDRQEFGFGMCSFRMSYEKGNIIKER